jgi:hypothetical protein
MLLRSVVAVGVCANAADTSNADAAKTTGMCFTDICFLPFSNCPEKTRHVVHRSAPRLHFRVLHGWRSSRSCTTAVMPTQSMRCARLAQKRDQKPPQ